MKNIFFHHILRCDGLILCLDLIVQVRYLFRIFHRTRNFTFLVQNKSQEKKKKENVSGFFCAGQSNNEPFWLYAKGTSISQFLFHIQMCYEHLSSIIKLSYLKTQCVQITKHLTVSITLSRTTHCVNTLVGERTNEGSSSSLRLPYNLKHFSLVWM